jgi:hypothetical protein
MSYFGRGAFDTNLTDMFAPRGVSSQGTSGFLFPFGSPNGSGCSAVCYVSFGVFAAVPTLGADMHALYPDFENTDLVLESPHRFASA